MMREMHTKQVLQTGGVCPCWSIQTVKETSKDFIILSRIVVTFLHWPSGQGGSCGSRAGGAPGGRKFLGETNKQQVLRDAYYGFSPSMRLGNKYEGTSMVSLMNDWSLRDRKQLATGVTLFDDLVDHLWSWHFRMLIFGDHPLADPRYASPYY